MNYLAIFISRLFEPMVVVLFLALLAGLRANLAGESFRLYALFLIGLIGLIGLIWMVLVQRFKTDWDISKRTKRIPPLIFLLGLWLTNWWFIRVKWNEIAGFYIFFGLWLLGFLLVTLRFKISGHVGVVTLTSLLIVRWFGLEWWPVTLVVPLVSWARIAGKYHTLGEAVAGALYSVIILLVYSP